MVNQPELAPQPAIAEPSSTEPANVIAPDRPLRVAVLAKQIPVVENMQLGPDGRLVRDGLEMHMNDYCRRAVAKGTEIAHASGGTVTIFTLGPPLAENVCREAILYGVNNGIHICDPAFAGSDTWATAKALAAALKRFGPYDLVLMGRNSVDADTGQVPPQVAEMLDLPFATGVRYFSLQGDQAQLRLEHDDQWVDVSVQLPAVLSCAERLCDPCKIKDPTAWATVDTALIQTVSAAELGDGPWGQAASPTSVGPVHTIQVQRQRQMLTGTLEEQADQAVTLLTQMGALDDTPTHTADTVVDSRRVDTHGNAIPSQPTNPTQPNSTLSGPAVGPAVTVLIEPGRDRINKELLGTAAALAAKIDGWVAAIGPNLDETNSDLGQWGADQQISINASATGNITDTVTANAPSNMVNKNPATQPTPQDIASVISTWANNTQPWAVLAAGTAWGREVAARMSATLNAGLTGDAVELKTNTEGRLIALKPAFGGQMVAEILCSSPIQMATVRPGVLPLLAPNPNRPKTHRASLTSPQNSRLKVIATHQEDDSNELANAAVVIGVGQGVDPNDYPILETHRVAIGAAICATRKVTDYGWMPRARQVGITGHSISPQLYLAIGTSGKFNHTVGVRNAGTILGINPDPQAPLWDVADIGIVGDWAQVFAVLIPRLAKAQSSNTLNPPIPLS
ncbi:MAG: FAD-binding protein [bacterium]|nr:FAD-binding protein [bacterium]MCY4257130.1 FAD-binding protein [bacterium]